MAQHQVGSQYASGTIGLTEMQPHFEVVIVANWGHIVRWWHRYKDVFRIRWINGSRHPG